MKLSPASWALVPEILTILKDHFPRAKTSYNKLLSRSLALQRSSEPETILLTPDGKVDGYGTFVFIIPNHRHEVHAFTLLENFDEFAAAILECNYIEWNKSPCFSCVHECLFPLIEIVAKSLPNNDLADCKVLSFHMAKEQALKFELNLPPNIEIQRLNTEHAELTSKLWPHGGTEEATRQVRDYILLYECIGLFTMDTKEMVAWCLHGEYGGPTILQVAEDHKRKGYGEICLKAMAIYAARLGFDPHAFVTLHNVASMSLFRKLGFKEMYYGSWAHFPWKGLK